MRDFFLDSFLSFCHFVPMTIYIKKVIKAGGSFRVVIPAQIIEEKGWQDANYFFIDDSESDAIKIKGVLNVQSIKAGE